DFEDLSNFRRETEHMCGFRQNYGSVGAPLQVLHLPRKLISVTAFILFYWFWMDAVDGFSLMAPELARGILNPTTDQPQGHPPKVPYPYPFPLCGWRGNDCLTPCRDPFPVCLERKCTVASGSVSILYCLA
ncbi:unnamed protein product, partial [Brassica oleracea]